MTIEGLLTTSVDDCKGTLTNLAETNPGACLRISTELLTVLNSQQRNDVSRRRAIASSMRAAIKTLTRL